MTTRNLPPTYLSSSFSFSFRFSSLTFPLVFLFTYHHCGSSSSFSSSFCQFLPAPSLAKKDNAAIVRSFFSSSTFIFLPPPFIFPFNFRIFLFFLRLKITAAIVNSEIFVLLFHFIFFRFFFPFTSFSLPHPPSFFTLFSSYSSSTSSSLLIAVLSLFLLLLLVGRLKKYTRQYGKSSDLLFSFPSTSIPHSY